MIEFGFSLGFLILFLLYLFVLEIIEVWRRWERNGWKERERSYN